MSAINREPAIYINDDPPVRGKWSSPPLLTDAEHRAMDLTVELWNLLAQEIVGSGVSRKCDLQELAHDLHAIQDRILAQAAGRSYPDRYRLLGETIRTEAKR